MQECPQSPFLLLGVENMRRTFPAVALFTTLCGIAGCSHREQVRKEASLRESLVVLRSEIGQFTLDHQRPPASLSELVSGGYLKRIPTDPFTGNNDTWRIQRLSAGEYLEVRSGSDAISSNGTKYSSW
jgi:general secretion pathway protein G